MDKPEEEDEKFASEWAEARKGVDYFHMAHVLSARLRQMDKRAKASNSRADAAEKALKDAQSQAYIDAARIAEEARQQCEEEKLKHKFKSELRIANHNAAGVSAAIRDAILQRKEEIGR